MGIILEFDANLPTQLWIVARYWQSISYLLALYAINKRINASYLLISGLTILTVLLFLIFFGLFPTSYIEGEGLTLFKIVSEYIINVILIASTLILYKFIFIHVGLIFDN